MALEIDNTIAEIEAEMKRAQAKSSGGNVSFFVLKDGEKALVRPLLNLNQVASLLMHVYWNPGSGKFDVNSVCAHQAELELPAGSCKHCATVKTMTDKKAAGKMAATKYFVVPLYVYGIKNAAGAPVTYTQDDKEVAVQGVRYLQLKPTSDILATLLEIYRDNGDITTGDLTISRKGEKLDTKYTVTQRPPAVFSVENVPAQSKFDIITRIAEMNAPEVIDGADPFPPSATTSAKASAPKDLDF